MEFGALRGSFACLCCYYDFVVIMIMIIIVIIITIISSTWTNDRTACTLTLREAYQGIIGEELRAYSLSSVSEFSKELVGLKL